MLDLYLALGLGFIVGYVLYRYRKLRLNLDPLLSFMVFLIVFFIGFNAGLSLSKLLAWGFTIIIASLTISLVNIMVALAAAILLSMLFRNRR